jgi:hypothetical protein
MDDKTICITGSRVWTDEVSIRLRFMLLAPGTLVVHGGARGADSIADKVAKELGLKTKVYTPDWNKYGRSAGLVRNEEMLRETKPYLLIAFAAGDSTAPISPGTGHAIRVARKIGIRVEVIRERPTNSIFGTFN